MQNQKSKSALWSNFPTYGQCYAFLRAVAVIIVLIAMFVLSVRCFAHVHLEIELSEHEWDKIEEDHNRQNYEKVKEDPDNASDREKQRAFEYEWDHMG